MMLSHVRALQQLMCRAVDNAYAPCMPSITSNTTFGGNVMPIINVIEVLTESPNSWEEAAQNAVKLAAQTLRGIESVYIQEFEAKIENDQITSYRVNAKITVRVEGRQ
jgi:dodecin